MPTNQPTGDSILIETAFLKIQHDIAASMGSRIQCGWYCADVDQILSYKGQTEG